MSDTTSQGLPTDAGKQRQRKWVVQWLKRIGKARVAVQPAEPQFAVPAVLENQFPVRRNDWDQLRKKIASLKEPAPYLPSVSWTCIGITAGTLLALLAWLPIDSELPVSAHAHYTFITPLLIITAIAGTVIAAFTFTVGHQAKQIHATTIENVLADMDAIYVPYSHTESGSAVDT